MLKSSLVLAVLVALAGAAHAASTCSPEGDFARYLDNEVKQEHISIKNDKAVLRTFEASHRLASVSDKDLRLLTEEHATVKFDGDGKNGVRSFDLVSEKGDRLYMMAIDCNAKTNFEGKAAQYIENPSVGAWVRVRNAQM
ncbi:hypothetical protein A9Y76_27130 (plasmid) [Ralstonia insidiosa]|uniref:Uncharacterized protein n=2 Tax=Burkholderiaceae TaxID=119060 RepID=A0A192A7P3_9RALS|nr:hypothetical protein A9Y76_27130 [Ralstonia insidiosa]KMW44857.1 hypothetical protein AC240_23130 [Ralstonia sp. MD27]MBA9913765.1 hypothetical protein [Ralstonia insidiosa]MBA9952522.1 hypothetical protein [Ralstonia insidiosa]MBA9968897.1 hypothetical protein [Ralstonia insidiosa]